MTYYYVMMLLVSLGYGQADTVLEDLILHQEKTGVILQGDGIVVPNARPFLMSTFIKLKNPSTLDACQYVCRIQTEDIWTLLTLEKCETSVNKIGDHANVIKTFEYKKSTAIDIDNDQMTKIAECFKECLKHQDCIAFGFEVDQSIYTCLLRNTMPMYYKNSVNSSEHDMRCMVEDKQKFCLTRMTKIDKLFEKTNTDFVNKTINVMNQLIDLSKTHEPRAKRQIEILGAGFVIGSLLTGAFSIYEQSKISSHISEFYDEYQKFRNDVTDFMETSTAFHKGMLKMYQDLETNLQKSLHDIDCEMSSISRFTLTQNVLRQWKDYINNIAKDLINGQFRGTISPVIFNKENIKQLLANDNLRNTIYHDNLPLFYRLGRMWLIDINQDKNYFNLHILISIPIIFTDEMNILYRVNHVGLVNDTSCMRLDVPNKVYKQNELYYKLDNENNCETRGGIKLCLGQNTSQKQLRLAPCLNGNPAQCNIRKEMCTLEFAQTGAGVMVRALKHLRASKKTNPQEYIDLSNSSVVKYIDYSEYCQIVVDNHIIHSLEEPILSKVLDLPNPDDWDEYLTIQSSILEKTNVSFLYDNLEKQHKIINDIKSRTLDLDFTKTMTLVNFVIISVAIACVLTACFICKCKCCKRDKNVTDKIEEKTNSDTECEDKHEIPFDTTTNSVTKSTSHDDSGQKPSSSKATNVTFPQQTDSKATNVTFPQQTDSKATNVTFPQPQTSGKTTPESTSSGLRNRSLSANKRPGPVTLDEIEKTV